MAYSSLTRRGLLIGSAAAAASCAHRKATGYLGYCFIADQIGRSVAVVDLSRFAVRGRIALDAAPGVVIPHPSQSKVFVLAPETGTVYEIDAATLAVSRRVRAGSRAVSAQMAPRRDALWVLYREPAALVEFPLGSLKPARRVRLPEPPDGFDLSVKDQAAIAIRQSRSIVLASLSTGAIERTIAAGAEPTLVSFQPLDGLQLIAGSQPERSVSIFDAATGKTMVRLPWPWRRGTSASIPAAGSSSSPATAWMRWSSCSPTAPRWTRPSSRAARRAPWRSPTITCWWPTRRRIA